MKREVRALVITTAIAVLTGILLAWPTARYGWPIYILGLAVGVAAGISLAVLLRPHTSSS